MSNQDVLTDDARRHLDAGRTLLAARNLPAAYAEFQQAARLAPQAEPVFAAMGELAMQAQDWKAAENLFRELYGRRPDTYRARYALALFNQQRHAEALPLFETLAASPNMDSNCALAFAMCLERCGQVERSINVMAAIYEAMPIEQMAVLLSSALLRVGRATELDHWLPRLLAAHPQNPVLAAARSEHAFMCGDYATAFDTVRHRWATTPEQRKSTRLHCPDWDGKPFAGPLLVTAEQGLGDEILCSSMFGELIRLGQEAVIDCEPRLLPLFRRSFPSLRFTDRLGLELETLARHEGHRARKIEAIELGRYFRRERANIPDNGPWLVPDPTRVGHWRHWLAQAFPNKATVGISWRSYRHLLGDSKSIPLAELRPLLENGRLACISLQYGDTAAEIAALARDKCPPPVAAPGLDATRDIDDLCALIAALDTVVTSSNTTAHLAGALGKATYVLIPGGRYVLWYWGHDGERTPWYPTLRLFRGPPQEGWQVLAARVAGLLTAPTTRSLHES